MPEVSRHQDLKKKTQSKLDALAHPEFPMEWRLAWSTVESKLTERLLHNTNNKEENIKVGGQYNHKYWVDIIG